MSKVAVIYWSQTGNTQQMAQAIAEGITGAGAECDLMEVSAVTPQQALEYDKLPVMDKWLLSKMNSMVKAVDTNLMNYQITTKR